MPDFYDTGLKYKDTNLWQVFRKNFAGTASAEKIIPRLKEYDLYVNIFWPLAHMKSAGTYLKMDPEVLKATGGTNWQKYLPPKFQKRMFFPELWTPREVEEWGIAAFKRDD
jgi:tryptophan 2,3-dioxygenase